MSGDPAGNSSKERLAASHRNGPFSGGNEGKPCWRVVAASCSAAPIGINAVKRNKGKKKKKKQIADLSLAKEKQCVD